MKHKPLQNPKESWIKNGTECYQAENYASCVLLYAIYLFRWIRDSNSGDFSQIHLEGGKKRKIMTCIFAKKSQTLTFVDSEIVFRSVFISSIQLNWLTKTNVYCDYNKFLKLAN